MDDFRQQTNELVQLPTEDLHKLVSLPPRCPTFQLVCQVVHIRCGTVIAAHLLCQPTRWDPPKPVVDDAVTSSVNWLQVTVNNSSLAFRR